MSNTLPLLRPLSRRNFQTAPASNTPSSTEPSSPPTTSGPPTPSSESNDPSASDVKLNGGVLSPSRTRSILNLTSSTLFGIYEGGRDEPNTPWGSGALTPMGPLSPNKGGSEDKKLPSWGAFQQTQSHRNIHPRYPKSGELIPTALRTVLLFAFGMAYGLVVTHLHDDHRLAPVKVGGIDRHSWHYLIFWGVAGIALGTLLPWVDVLRMDNAEGKPDTNKEGGPKSDEIRDSEEETLKLRPRRGLDADWNSVVRSIGAFIGIAFAIRRLPWQSNLQVSLTFALVNPVLWYLVDRSKAGFMISTFVGLTGTVVLSTVNPDIVPSPAIMTPTGDIIPNSTSGIAPRGLISPESIAVWTWIASVLFCSCVCFGNIGRRLAFAWPGNSRSQ